MSTDPWPLFADDAAFEAVQDALMAAGLGDGLPMVPPTPARLAAMLAGCPDPDAVLGHMPPLFGEVTPRALAWCALAAGATPAAVPVLRAVALAVLEPQFNLLGLMTTTGSAAVATLVHGPIVARLGLNAGTNCLGPGNRANATLGRAISLVLRNIGGARADSGDMATLGQPGKYAFCLPESAPGTTHAMLPPLHVRRGLDPQSDAVTVLGVSGTAELLPLDERDTPEAILAPVALSMATAFVVGGAYRQPALPGHIFVLPPELAGLLAGHGWDLARIQEHLFATARHDGRPVAASPADIAPIVTGGAGVKMAHLPLWGGGSVPVTLRVTLPVTAGG